MRERFKFSTHRRFHSANNHPQYSTRTIEEEMIEIFLQFSDASIPARIEIDFFFQSSCQGDDFDWHYNPEWLKRALIEIYIYILNGIRNASSRAAVIYICA